MSIKNKLKIFFLSLLIFALNSTADTPIYLYATQSGKTTLDQGVDGGNPFASAFVELLGYETLTVRDFTAKLTELTLQKSKNFQKPEITPGNYNETLFLPKPKDENWIALVIVFSLYLNHNASSLLGAKNDFITIQDALLKKGYNLLAVIDPSKEIIDNTLKTFANVSKSYDRAIIYTTGHGFEHNASTYLIRGDYPYRYRETNMSDYAIPLKKLGDTLNTKEVNLLFFGGCRNRIF